MSPNVHIA